MAATREAAPAGDTRPGRRLSPPLPALAAFLLANAVLVNALALALGTPRDDTDLHPIAWFVSGRQGGDSWRPMLRAYDHLRSRDERSRGVYERLFFNPEAQRNPFQYPPSSLLAVWGAEGALGTRRLFALEAATWLSIPLLAAAAFALFAEQARRPLAAAGWTRRDWAALAVLAALATLAFYPAMRAYRNGQIQAWINAGFGVTLWLWLRGARGCAGLCLGAVCLVKPHYAVILLWGALRRQWRFVAAAAGVLAAGLGVALALFGADAQLDYLGVVAFASRHGESFYANQSVNGLLQRLLGNGPNLEWRMEFPPYHPAVYAGTLVSSSALLLVALWPPRDRGARAGLFDLALVCVAATAASPIAWEHHYGVLLPVFAAIAPALLGASARLRAALGLAYLLASHTLRFTDVLAASWLNLAQSYLLAGALAVIGLLLRLRTRGAA